MDWLMDLDIQRFFREDAQRRKALDDRYLHDFSSVWRGLPKDETGMRDGNVSQAYYEAYIKARKQDGTTATGTAQGQFNLPSSGLACAFDPKTGNLVIHGAIGSMVIVKEELPDFVNGINGPRPEDVVQPEPIRNNPVVFPQQASSNLSPQIKRRMNNNLRELERWAKASSKSWPK